MNDDVILRLTGRQKTSLQNHLFPGDGREALAFALCGQHGGLGRQCLSVMEIHPIPYENCKRAADRVAWPTDLLKPLLERANSEGLSVIKIHSHPAGFNSFSDTDDASDQKFFSSAASWVESDAVHASVVMLPCGAMFGRYGHPSGKFQPLQIISVAGEVLEYWAEVDEQLVPDFADRHAQVLGEGTFAKLRRLRVAVIGCSGTGSPVVEQLFRLGVGELVLVDPDTVGVENLNRVVNSRGRHASRRTPKVKVLADAIEETELGTHIFAIQSDLFDPDTIRKAASCDLIFGCVDSVFARHLINKIASTYCIPYIDVGVGLKADGRGGIAHATGAVHYLQPDGSSLMSRGVFTSEDVRADAMRRINPDEHAEQFAQGYIKGADVSRPAVITLNNLFASYGVLEMLNRLHPIRLDGNESFAMQRWSLSGDICETAKDGDRCKAVSRYLGRGDFEPLLGIPSLSRPAEREPADA